MLMRVRDSRAFYRICSWAAFSLLVLLAGCGASIPHGLTNPVSAPTVTITSSAASISPGSSSTLTVVATNAAQVKVTGTDGSSYTLAAAGGTQAVTPTATTTYTATATGTIGAGSATATTTVTVAVQPPSGIPTVSIAANPASISAGSSSTLTVAATNAATVTVSGTDGSNYTLPAAGGTQKVSPAATTTYTATATGPGGTITATTVVTVSAAGPNAPTVTIAANPASINTGGSSTLTVAATNATQVIVSGSDGSTYTLQANGGTQAVSPTSTTIYTATASGNGATATATATVTVAAPQAPPTVSITAAPTTIPAGNSSTLTVAATNATQVTVTGSDGSTATLAPNGGTEAVSPITTTTYTATATGTGTPATATTTVTVVPPPPPAAATVTIAASPASITAGGSSTLTVSATNATQVTVTGTDGSTYNLQPAGGTQVVSPTATTTYNVSATGASTPASASTIVTVTQPTTPTVTIAANPASITTGSSSNLTVTATNATKVTVTGSDSSSYNLQPSGGTQAVSPAATTTYTATATGNGTSVTGTATVTVTSPGTVQSVNHVIFMLQENHSFDNYFGMLNPYRQANHYDVADDGKTYLVDGIDDKLTIANTDDEGNSHPLFKLATTCIDDLTSSWLESYGDVNRYNFDAARPIFMDGFVHTAEGFAKSCAASGTCSGTFTDLAGQRAMGYYDEGFLNYYYYMASQFALSNRWFSPISSKSIPNRIATFTGGTTQGLVFDPGQDDKLPQLNISNIFQELDTAKVSWKVYYTVTNGGTGPQAAFPATTFSILTYSYQYLYGNPTHATCTGTTQPSSVVGDSSNSFCIDPNHIAPIANYFSDLTNGTLPSFSFIESGSGANDEHPGSGQSVLIGQAQVANVVNSFMASPEWKDSVFFLSYDEGGGPYDHVPPVPGHSNDNSNPALGAPDISQIAVNPESNPAYFPCVPTTSPATLHCDLRASSPGAKSNEAPAVRGFAAQLGFRVPNMVISPFTRKHYVSNIPMDHTAVIKFVENRFIGSSANLTARDAAQPNLLDFFDFSTPPWATPPTPPAPASAPGPCTPDKLQ